MAFKYYAGDDYNERVYTHPSHEDLNERVEEIFYKRPKNPFHDAYIWAKSEHLNLLGMLECLNGRELVSEY